MRRKDKFLVEQLIELKDRIYKDMGRKHFLRRILSDEPGKESHVLEQHVGKSDADRLQRGFEELSDEKHDYAVSTFTDVETLENRLIECLTEMFEGAPDFFYDLAQAETGERMALCTVLDPESYSDLFAAMQPCVSMDDRGHLSKVETNIVRVVFRREIESSLHPYGFSVVTAFPDPFPSLPIAKSRGNLAKPIVRDTREDLTEALCKTPFFQHANPVRQAQLLAAARPFPKTVSRLRYDPGDAGHQPSICLDFAAKSASKRYRARIREESVSIEEQERRVDEIGLPRWIGIPCDISDPPQRRARLADPRNRHRLHLANDLAARFMEDIERSLAGLSRPEARSNQMKEKTHAQTRYRAQVAAVPDRKKPR